MWSDNKIDHLRLGNSGEFYIGDPAEKDIGYFKPIIDVLKSLPVRNVTQTAYSRSSMVLRTNKNGRLEAASIP